MKVNDRQLRLAYSELLSKLASDSSFVADEAALLRFFAAAADRAGHTAAMFEAELATADTEESLAELLLGIDATERADLRRILKEGTLPLTPGARAVLETIAGQSRPEFTEVHLDSKGQLKGYAPANATIEALNLSTAPLGRYQIGETVPVGKSDANGRFAGRFVHQLAGTKQGDVVRLRARLPDGTTTPWVTVRIDRGAHDNRNARVALFRLGLAADSSGQSVALSNINPSRQISEPGARLRFVNQTTLVATEVTLDDDGNLPPNTTLPGRAGDDFTVAVTDGANNTDWKQVVGTVRVPGSTTGGSENDLPDPPVHKDELNAQGVSLFGRKRFTGPLFSKGVSMRDVRQGQLGDCYFAASMASIAALRPETITHAIQRVDENTFVVTFKAGTESVSITVDGDLWVRSNGEPLYGSSAGSKRPDKLEMWFPIIEKAYAQWKGSYNAIGSGGWPGGVIAALTGGEPYEVPMSGLRKDTLWEEITSALNEKRPSCLTTSKDEARYTNTGVYDDHTYSIVGYKVDARGRRMVQLRNPWGESEPGNDGNNDGIFWMSLDGVARLYEGFHSVTSAA